MFDKVVVIINFYRVVKFCLIENNRLMDLLLKLDVLDHFSSLIQMQDRNFRSECVFFLSRLP